MNALVALGNKLLDWSRLFAWLPPLAARFTLGWVFWHSGWGKLQHLDRVAGYFGTLGLPSPAFLARFVSSTEFIAGILVLIGLATRIASVPLVVIMVIALRTAQAENYSNFSELTGLIEYLYILLLLWLIVSGPGKIAVDAWIARKYRR